MSSRKEDLQRQLRETSAVLQELALQLFRGGQAPGDEGLYFHYYSREANEIRRKRDVVLRKFIFLKNALDEIESKEEK